MKRKVLIVGLGNVGDQYVCTRHNVGFHVADILANIFHEEFSLKKSLQAFIATHVNEHGTIIIAKPSQYMNNSGHAVAALCKWYELSPENCIIVTDNIDLQTGDLRFKKGSPSAKQHSGTHNGIRSIVQCLGSNNFMRLYLGIGGFRKENEDLASYVLRKWPKSQHDEYNLMCTIAANVLEGALSDDYDTLTSVLAKLKQELMPSKNISKKQPDKQ